MYVYVDVSGERKTQAHIQSSYQKHINFLYFFILFVIPSNFFSLFFSLHIKINNFFLFFFFLLLLYLDLSPSELSSSSSSSSSAASSSSSHSSYSDGAPTLHLIAYSVNQKGRSEPTVLEDIAINEAEKRTGTCCL